MSEKHLVCQGAVCRCDFGTTTDKLMVKTQVNDTSTIKTVRKS